MDATDWEDDEPTVIEVREVPEEPPALPFTLRRARSREEEAWLAVLPPEARDVLEAARYPVACWPIVDRVAGAVAIPVDLEPEGHHA